MIKALLKKKKKNYDKDKLSLKMADYGFFFLNRIVEEKDWASQLSVTDSSMSSWFHLIRSQRGTNAFALSSGVILKDCRASVVDIV